jgi:hypothetical protein
MAGRATRVVRANSNGRVVFRAQVVGFSGAGPASAFCARLKAAGQDCLVRGGSGR